MSACIGFKTVHESQDLLETIIPLHDNVYISRDLDNSNEKNPNKFNEIHTCSDLKQHANFLAHVHCHWLDLVITERVSNSIKLVLMKKYAWLMLTSLAGKKK